MTALRNALIYLAIVGMIQAPIPAVSHAEAAPTQRGQEIDDILEKLPRVHHDERLITLMDRLVPHMGESMRLQLVDIGLGEEWWKMPTPDITVSGRTVTFGEGKDKFVIAVEELPHGIGVALNGQKFDRKNFKTLKDLTQRVREIMKAEKSSKKKSALWSAMVPEARALDWMSGLLGLGVGIIGTMLFNKWNSSNTTAAAPAPAPSCSTAQCCVISNQAGGQYVVGPAPYCCTAIAQQNPSSSVYGAGMVDANCNGPYPPQQAAYVAPTAAAPILKGASPASSALPAMAKPATKYKAAPVQPKKPDGQN